MKLKVLVFLGVIGLISQFIIGSPTAFSAGLSAAGTPEALGTGEVAAVVGRAIFGEIAAREGYGWGVSVYDLQLDEIKISSDGKWATAWEVYYDEIIEQVVPSEPGLIVAKLEGETWIIYLSGDAGWLEAIQAAPEDLISLSDKEMWKELSTFDPGELSPQTIGGYHLPWEEGNTVSLSRSVSHDESYPSGKAHYSWDFYIPQTMWPIYAAKSGTVYSFRDDVPNNDHTEVNFIVLQNADDPSLFQLYMHLAQYSIPPDLKQVGAQVTQGQYIATVDNTGQSTGHHLHFQVEIQPNWPDYNPYWNQSVDITFDEVDIYGGRPRREFEYDYEFCGGLCVNGRLNYISANSVVVIGLPPYGDFSGVTLGDVVTTQNLVISGWGADDDDGLDYGQLIANYGGEWHNLGNPFTSSFTYNWDLCTENAVVPDGAVSVALRLFDNIGNWKPLVGLRHFTKDFSCPQPPPGCLPAIDQVTLFEDADYGGGCVRFNLGDYPDSAALGAIGGNDASSILVGGSVAATLYSDSSYGGHSETIPDDDSYLADNIIGADNLSSLRVALRTSLPSAPSLVSPTEGQAYQEGDLISLSWINNGGATEYQVTIIPQTAQQIIYPWQSEPFLRLSSMAQGNYSWQVRGRNAAGEGTSSLVNTFTVGTPSSPPTGVTAPFSDGFESDPTKWTWTGQWTLVEDADVANNGSFSWWYQGSDGDYSDGGTNFGSLTSPPITIPAVGYYLRFYYRYETETHYRWWDQRWVQISVDGEPFTDVIQLTEDPMIPEAMSWLASRVIDLGEYSGHNLRFSFDFNTLDASSNTFAGWGIDDFSITTTPPADCTDIRQDDLPTQATLISYNPSLDITGEVCPGGDVDFYKFTGSVGDRMVIDVDASDDGSPLDPYLILYDTDGTTVLAEHDDEVIGEHRDPLLGYTLPRDGIYYFKLRAWNHPSVGGSSYDYSLRLFTDAETPQVSITSPLYGDYLPDNTFTVTVQADDAIDEIGHVDFYWHANYWLIAAWTALGTDWDDSDGWSYPFDPAGLAEGVGAAFYVHAYDRAGNWAGTGSWNLGVDKTAPSTAMQPLASAQESTAILLEWTGTDEASGIDYFNMQSALDNGTWTTYPGNINGLWREMWFVGTAGHEYGFRLRGVDQAGNTEIYHNTSETSTIIPSASQLCLTMDAYDNGGNDNTPANASVIILNGSSQAHNVCNPLTTDHLNDLDWIKFDVQIGKHYLIHTKARGEETAITLKLYTNDGITLIDEASADGFGLDASLGWVADRSGTVYVRMSHLDGRVIGSPVTYEALVKAGYWIYMPWAEK